MTDSLKRTGLCGCSGSRHCSDCAGVIPSGYELDMDEVRHVAKGEPHWFTTKLARRILELEAQLVESACICGPDRAYPTRAEALRAALRSMAGGA